MKVMKRFFFPVMLSIMFFACGKEAVKGGGETTTEQRSVGAFSAVSVRGSTKIHITQGDSIDVQVKAYSKSKQ